MDHLVKKIDELLKDEFPDSETELELLEESEKISGFLVWDGFEGKDQLKRQRRLWKILKKGLTEAEWLRIAAILTTTPTEMTVMREA